MCGIAGIWGPPSSDEALRTVAGDMATTLAHRGPDGKGVWIDAEAGIGFGHRRLAIVDLSTDGAQPMISHDGRYVLIFNGEIYNFVELRAELEATGARFVGHSDTEVMLAAIVRWGVVETLRRCNGQVALALWDRTRRTLTLARDRFGKKPLYYAVDNSRLLFGSELKALMAVPGFSAEIDDRAAGAFFRYGFVPGSQSILTGVHRLEPGTAVQFSAPSAAPTRTAYWSFDDAVGTARKNRLSADSAAVEEMLHEILVDAVRIRQRVDVPFGAFLSGGIDSSLVVAMMQEAGGEPVRTFTIGFSDAAYDESADADAVARALGCRHTSAILEPDQLAGLAEQIPIAFDEPFADVSQVPTQLVSRLAREQVTVCFTGDGGDEMFGGYHRHFVADRYWNRLCAIPLGGRRMISGLAGALGERGLAAVFRGTSRNPTEMGARAMAALGAADIDALYSILLSHNRGSHLAAGGASALRTPSAAPDGFSVARHMMALDTLNYLPDDILVKADRASMSTSLEIRCPLLDPRLLEFSWRLSDDLLIGGNRGKIILRRLLARYLPRSLFDRPKAGFSVPIAEWLRKPLKGWAGDVLFTGRDSWIRGEEIERCWSAHQERRGDFSQWLWRALMWKSWRRQWTI